MYMIVGGFILIEFSLHGFGSERSKVRPRKKIQIVGTYIGIALMVLGFYFLKIPEMTH